MSLTGPSTVILCSLYYSSDKLHSAPLMKYAWHIGATATDTSAQSLNLEADLTVIASAGERLITDISLITEAHLRTRRMYS